MHGVLEKRKTTGRVRSAKLFPFVRQVRKSEIMGLCIKTTHVRRHNDFVFHEACNFRSPVIVGPALLIGGMWGYPGGPIMDMLCLESM